MCSCSYWMVFLIAFRIILAVGQSISAEHTSVPIPSLVSTPETVSHPSSEKEFGDLASLSNIFSPSSTPPNEEQFTFISTTEKNNEYNSSFSQNFSPSFTIEEGEGKEDLSSNARFDNFPENSSSQRAEKFSDTFSPSQSSSKTLNFSFPLHLDVGKTNASTLSSFKNATLSSSSSSRSLDTPAYYSSSSSPLHSVPTSSSPSTSLPPNIQASAEPLLGTMMMPAIPSSFPLMEFTDYGIQGQFLPSESGTKGSSDLLGRKSERRPNVKANENKEFINRQGHGSHQIHNQQRNINRFPEERRTYIHQSQNPISNIGHRPRNEHTNVHQRTHSSSGSVIPGFVPVNSYHNPTTGIARVRSRPAFGTASDTGHADLRPHSRRPSNKEYEGYPDSPIDRSDPIDYFNYPNDLDVVLENLDGKQDEGSLHAALQTLWQHRNQAYSSLEDQDDTPSAANEAWLQNVRERHKANRHGVNYSQFPVKSSDNLRRPSHSIKSHSRLPSGSTTRHWSVNTRPQMNNHDKHQFISARYPHSGFNQEHERHLTQASKPSLPNSTRRTQNVPRINQSRPNIPQNIARPPTSIKGGLRKGSQFHTQDRRPGTIVGGNRRNDYNNRFPVKNYRPHQRTKTRYSVERLGSAVNADDMTFPTTNPPANRPMTVEDDDNYDMDNYGEYDVYSSLKMYDDTTGNRFPSGTMENIRPFELDSIETERVPGASSLDTISLMSHQLLKNGANTGSMTEDDKLRLANLQELVMKDAADKSGWMSQVGDVMSGVSEQLPSLEKAITTMSFLAFGIFMSNLLLQAVANSTALTSFLGREDRGDSLLSLDLLDLPLDLEELDFDMESWKDKLENDDGNLSLVKQLLKILGQVYLRLHEITRTGMYNMVTTLGIGLPEKRMPPGAQDMDPECFRRLLCEGHHITAPHFQHTSSYKLLPFWTMGASWLSGDDNIPRLLEELRAEVAGQEGLACASIFPNCNDKGRLHRFLEMIEDDFNESLQNENLDE